MNNIKFATLHYASRLKYLVAVIIFVWILSYIFSSFGGSSRSTRLVAPFPMSHQQLAYNSTIAKTIEYCNPAHTIKAVDEGKSPVHDGKLEFVAVVTRHGNKAPLRIVRNQMDIKCTPGEDEMFSNFMETASRVIPRSRFGSINHYPEYPQCVEAGMLTGIGASQQVRLGHQLRQAYIEKLGFMKSWTPENVIVISTTFGRTYQSAVAFLYGFLNGSAIETVEIFSAGSPKFCMSSKFCNCDLLDVNENLMHKRSERLWKSQPIIVSIIDRLSPVIKYHPDQINIRDPYDLYDTLMGYVCHHQPLPCIPGTNNCVTHNDVHESTKYIHWHKKRIKEIQGSYFLRKYGLLSMQGFLFRLVQRIQNSIGEREQTKFMLFSGHDMAIDLLLDTFGVEAISLVPYAGRLSFEVYSFWTEEGDEYAIKIIYNGRDITAKATFCKEFFTPAYKKSNPLEYGVCLLEQFETFVAVAMHELGDISFETACFPTT